MRLKNFDLDAGFTYNKRYFPNNTGTGYGGNGYLYNLVVWSGTEFDIRDYRNYWVKGKEGFQQNWMDKVWYNNPYYIANEMINSSDYDVTNSFLTGTYKVNPWLKATLRSGIDYYSQKIQSRNPIGTVGDAKGSYSKSSNSGYSLNNDLMLMAKHSWGNFGVDGLVGGSIYYWNDNSTSIATQNGLKMPGFYSIYSSVDPAKADQSQSQQQTNSLYGKATLSWKKDLFVDVTGRNDWSSTLSKDERSYFYPSVVGSWVVSETFQLPSFFDMLKLRGSWTKSKTIPGVYSINTTYGLSVNAWDNLTAAYYPGTIRDKTIRPQKQTSIETGVAMSFLKNRLTLDVTYYNNLIYDRIATASVSRASGFTATYINFGEELRRKGVEITLGATPVKNKNLTWDVLINWSRSNVFFDKLDSNYSVDYPWVTKGARYDYLTVYDYDRSPDGSIIHSGGYPQVSKYASKLGNSAPSFIFGISNTFRWKDITLSFSIDGRVGGLIFNTMEQALWNSGSHIKSDNEYRYDQVVNGKKSYVGQGVVFTYGTVKIDAYGNIIPGSDTRVFDPNATNVSYESYMLSMNPYIGSQRIQNFFDGTFIKLRDLSISYTLPYKLIRKAGFRSMSVGFVGQNLLLWTKAFKYSDPDVAFDNLNSPSIRYLGGNITFTF